MNSNAVINKPKQIQATVTTTTTTTASTVVSSNNNNNNNNTITSIQQIPQVVVTQQQQQLIAPTTTTSINSNANNNPNYGGFAYCANCGEYGVKAAFYGKSKLYCSVACQSGIKKTIQQQQQHQSNKRPYDSISENTSPLTTTATTTTSISTSLSSSSSSPSSAATTTTPILPSTPNKIQKTNHINHSSTSTTATATTTISLPTSTTSPSTSSVVQPQAPLVVKSPTTTTSNSSFSWPFYIEFECENAEAAPVYAFKHVPLCDFWGKIINGVKLEVPNRDFSSVDEKYNYWFASVIKFAGYMAKLRYVGFEEDGTHDFWVHLCDNRIQPVGWAAENETLLIPPTVLADKVDDWKVYLIDKLTGYKTLPKNFHRRVKDSLKTRFNRGMLLELIDKKKLSRMKVSRIIDNVGGRLRMKYENSEDFDDFWCHQNSELIHPIGWSAFNGHDIDASGEYKKTSLEKILRNTYDANECTPDMFKKMRELPPEKAIRQFKPAMKLEAIDPLNLSAICVATVGKVLKNNYLMIRIDGCKSEDGSDMFCYSRTSSSIFPAGFCQMNNIPLQAPYDYKGEFNWETYLRETNSQYAPAQLFYSDDTFINPFKVGMKLESVDLMEPKMICVATVVSVINRLIRLNFDGWESEYDQWVDCESCDIYPVGWCHLVGYNLEPPRKSNSLDNSMSSSSKKKSSKKSLKRYSKK